MLMALKRWVPRIQRSLYTPLVSGGCISLGCRGLSMSHMMLLLITESPCALTGHSRLLNPPVPWHATPYPWIPLCLDMLLLITESPCALTCHSLSLNPLMSWHATPNYWIPLCLDMPLPIPETPCALSRHSLSIPESSCTMACHSLSLNPLAPWHATPYHWIPLHHWHFVKSLTLSQIISNNLSIYFIHNLSIFDIRDFEHLTFDIRPPTIQPIRALILLNPLHFGIPLPISLICMPPRITGS